MLMEIITLNEVNQIVKDRCRMTCSIYYAECQPKEKREMNDMSANQRNNLGVRTNGRGRVKECEE
jgi:hypothetical protein